MKSLCLSLITVLSLLLTGCAGRAEEEKFQKFSQALNEKEALSFVSQLRCEYEDRSVNFTLSFSGNPQGCSVTVLEPEIIAGIKANLSPGDTELQFEDMVLDTGNLDSYGLSPMSALPELVKALSQGSVDTYYSDESGIVYELLSDKNCRVSVRFRPEGMVPLSAEIISDGKVRVFCKIGNWQ